jgi:hypothetical protein
MRSGDGRADGEGHVSGESSRQIGGKYTFRFSGFARGPDERPYHIVGVGMLDLAADGKLTGNHRSTIAPLSGAGRSMLRHSVYALAGRYDVRDDGTATTTVFFHKEAGAAPTMMDVFEIVPAGGPDRLWFISTAPKLLPSNVPVDEVVTVEAMRCA